jgi:hypothetical protein
LARRALERNPADREARLVLGLALEAAGREEEAVGVLASFSRSGSEPPSGAAVPPEATAALNRLLPSALPARMAADQLAMLPGAGAAGTVGAVSFQVIAPTSELLRPAVDPKYGWSFTHRAAVYMGEQRRYSIYYQEASDRELASRIGELLGRLHAAAVLLGTPPSTEVRVWLPRSGQAGGEQYRDSIYLFAVQVPRSDSEWVREVSHELGHIVLPSLARFDAPEPMENGYLGERLLPQGLFELGERSVWGGKVSLADYVQTRAVPLRSRFLAAGPDSPLRADRGPAGMDYAIGLVLTLEMQHGPQFLVRVFHHTVGAGIESLLLAYRDEVAASAGYRIPAFMVVPAKSDVGGLLHGRLPFRRAVYRAYLPSGRWRLTARGAGLREVAVRVDQQPLRATGRGGEVETVLTADVSRWHLLQWETKAPGAALAEIEIRPAAGTTRRGVETTSQQSAAGS